ncbi:hypothetical protein L1049_003733 [Liquidambar formosana]|uniref:Uncharacterized protein n=1 Tax=Liquidambar formosana TaxID=63359 RepID=A0AAP0RNE3_LIQFO
MPDALYNLMMLAQVCEEYSLNSGRSYNKQRVDVSEATINSNSLSNKVEIEDKNQDTECVAPSEKKRRIEVSPVGQGRNCAGKKLKTDETGSNTDDGNSSEIPLKGMERGKGEALLKTQFLPEND